MAFIIFIFLALIFFCCLFFHMGDIHVASLNVNGARDCIKCAAIYEIMKRKQNYVLFKKHTDATNAIGRAKEFKGLPLLSHKTLLS